MNIQCQEAMAGTRPTAVLLVPLLGLVFRRRADRKSAVDATFQSRLGPANFVRWLNRERKERNEELLLHG